MAGGLGDVPPKTKRGDESPTLATTPRVGPKTLANPKPMRVGKGGGGGFAPSQGVWGMCPQNKKGGRVAHLSHPATSGTQDAGKPSANGGGKGGSRGAKPPWQGVWGMCPKNQTRGRAAPISTPATSGTQNAGKP